MQRKVVNIIIIALIAAILFAISLAFYAERIHKEEICCELSPTKAYCVTVYQVGAAGWSFGPVTTQIVLKNAEGKTLDKCTFELNNDGGSVGVYNVEDISWFDSSVEVDMRGADDRQSTTYTLWVAGTAQMPD